MRDEDGKVNWSNPPVHSKTFRASVVMIDEVGGEKECRNHNSGDHTVSMGSHLPLSDQHISNSQQNGTNRIQRGIDGRQVRDGDHSFFPQSGFRSRNLRLRNGF